MYYKNTTLNPHNLLYKCAGLGKEKKKEFFTWKCIIGPIIMDEVVIYRISPLLYNL